MNSKPKRPYRLSREGLRRLRENIRKVRPWEKSTGPRTPEGKVRSARNALYTFDNVVCLHLLVDKTEAALVLAGALMACEKARLSFARERLHALKHHSDDPKTERRLVADEEGRLRILSDRTEFILRCAERLVELGDYGGLGQMILGDIHAWQERQKDLASEEGTQG